MKLSQDDFELLEEQANLHHVGNRTQSTALLAWFLENVMREDPDEVEDAICDGGGDRGIDAIIFDEDANELFVLQAKRRRNRKTTQGEADLKQFVGVAAYFEEPEGVDRLLESEPNDELVALINRLELRKRLEESAPSVRLLFVTNAARDATARDYLATVGDRQPSPRPLGRSAPRRGCETYRAPGALTRRIHPRDRRRDHC